MDDVYLDFDRLRLLFVGSKVHFSVHTYNTALNSTTVFHKCVTLGMSTFFFLSFFFFVIPLNLTDHSRLKFVII